MEAEFSSEQLLSNFCVGRSGAVRTPLPLEQRVAICL